jgi:hypothetical protein
MLFAIDALRDAFIFMNAISSVEEINKALTNPNCMNGS